MQLFRGVLGFPPDDFPPTLGRKVLKAEPTAPYQPGDRLAVQAGQKVRDGSPLLSLEAMKMETHLHADRDGSVEKVLAAAGDQMQAKDLLLIVKPGAE